MTTATNRTTADASQSTNRVLSEEIALRVEDLHVYYETEAGDVKAVNGVSFDLRGMWWWWGSPIVIFILLFSGLFIASIGLDEWANPRLKERS